MREILFKGKRIDNGEFAYGSLIQAGTYCCILESEEDAHPMDYPYLDHHLYRIVVVIEAVNNTKEAPSLRQGLFFLLQICLQYPR